MRDIALTLATWTTVRVFISSTFRDMQAERDHLVRHVFPGLREHLLSFRIHLIDVDLRWGVTREQDAGDVCREVIDECRPRFLCILGGRYGTVPDGKTHSLTADEVHYGVLDRDLPNRGLAYFYFRDDAATESMVETVPGEFREPPGSDGHSRLAELKRAIRDAGLDPVTYTARWDTHSSRLIDLKRFGDRVRDDILRGIMADPAFRERFVEGGLARPSEFAEEEAAIETFIGEWARRFVLGSRRKVAEELLAHARAGGGNGDGNRNGYCCLTGAPGSGKSAMLAHLSAHPDLLGDATALVVPHFAGVGPGSTDVRRTLRRLCSAIQKACPQLTADVPEDPEELRLAFWDLLRQASATRSVVILLDGVDQLDLRPPFSSFHWLPSDLPTNVRIILSTQKGPALEDLRRTLAPSVLTIEPLTSSDREAIVELFLRRYGKKLEKEQREALLDKAGAGIPLYLLAALEEVRTLGTREEITRRIAELPPTTAELFLWILQRLADDDGFRDGAGKRVGRSLVSRFAALLAASRHGLTQRDMSELTDPGDPEGNVAALLYLLRPYLMRCGKMIDFYHGQFRAAATGGWLDTDARRRAAHAALAEHFHRRADPKRSHRWSHDSRILGELPFHLAEAGRRDEVRGLFSELAYLAARIASGQTYEQVADYGMLGSPLPADTAPWHVFLQKHAQRLANHPAMLVGLVNHEGFAEARFQVGQAAWSLPWLRTTAEAMPRPSKPLAEGFRAEATAAIEFPSHSPCALAEGRLVAFRVEHLGAVRILDLQSMRPTDSVLSIRRNRVLTLACAPEAGSLAVFYETGQADLYRCTPGSGGHPVALERVAEFPYLLPEIEDPVVVWHDGAYWYQSHAGAIASVSVERPRPSEERFAEGLTGELCALTFVGNARVIALRQGRGVAVLTPGAVPFRRELADLAAACACGPNRLAAAFTDGEIVVFDLNDALRPSAGVRAGIPRGAIGWDGTRLLWLSDVGHFTAWEPRAASSVPVQDNQAVFPARLHVVPRQWVQRPDGSLLLGTTHGIVTLHVLKGGAATDGRLEHLFGGPTWRAVRRRDRDQWLLERRHPSERLIGREVMGRLYCAQDGKGRFYAPSGSGPGNLVDLETMQGRPLESCPIGINVAAGDEAGGCWLTDRTGDIYFIDEHGRCRRVVEIGLPDVHGAGIENCGDHLLWVGYSSKHFPESGMEPARTLVFFRKIRGDNPKLERIGEQFRHPREGLCLAARYDAATDRLVTLWITALARGEAASLRVAPVTAFIRWEYTESPMAGLKSSFVQAQLSADGCYLGILTRAGEIACVSVSDGRIMAVLEGSSPFTAVAPGGSGPEFWIAEADTRVYGCRLIEGTPHE